MDASTLDSTPDFEPASAHLEAEIVARRGTSVVKTARTLANLAMGMLTGEADSAVPTTDLVVTRREGGGEILRISGGGLVYDDQLLQRVRADLDTKTVTEFIAEWRVIDAGE